MMLKRIEYCCYDIGSAVLICSNLEVSWYCLINDPNKIADAFNEHFSNIDPKLADKIGKGNWSYVNYLSDYNIDASFQLKETDSSTVSILLLKLSKSKTTGLDKISCRLLRECSDLIAESLSLIFNRSIIMGIFPNEWKCAKVVPIHKQGNAIALIIIDQFPLFLL